MARKDKEEIEEIAKPVEAKPQKSDLEKRLEAIEAKLNKVHKNIFGN